MLYNRSIMSLQLESEFNYSSNSYSPVIESNLWLPNKTVMPLENGHIDYLKLNLKDFSLFKGPKYTRFSFGIGSHISDFFVFLQDDEMILCRHFRHKKFSYSSKYEWYDVDGVDGLIELMNHENRKIFFQDKILKPWAKDFMKKST